MSAPEITKLLILSTLHMKPTTSAELDRLSCDELLLPRGSYDDAGHFIHVPDPAWEPIVLNPMFEDLLPVFDKARELGCKYVLLDRDADVLDDLPTYDWS